MSNMSICELCNKLFASKYTLAVHCRNKHEPRVATFECVAAECQHVSTSKSDLDKHMKNCKLLLVEQAISQKQVEFDSMVAILTREKEELRTQLKEAHQTIKELAERAIDKPTVSTSTTHNNNNNMNMVNMLCDRTTFDAQTDPDRIVSIAREHFESYFWQGQRGVAQFCVDHIIKSPNGKMLLVCTDPSRKRFRYMTADQQLAEDIGALQFTDRISVPMKTVCHEVYSDIIQKLDQEKESLIEAKAGAFEIGFLDTKRDKAFEKLIAIREIDDNDHNHQYKNTLSTLLNV